jgi:hypothetical protein
MGSAMRAPFCSCKRAKPICFPPKLSDQAAALPSPPHQQPLSPRHVAQHVQGQVRSRRGGPQRRDIEATISEVLVPAGAIEGLAAAVMAAVDPGDSAADDRRVSITATDARFCGRNVMLTMVRKELG